MSMWILFASHACPRFPLYVTAYFSKPVDEESFDMSKIKLSVGRVVGITKLSDTTYQLEIDE